MYKLIQDKTEHAGYILVDSDLKPISDIVYNYYQFTATGYRNAADAKNLNEAKSIGERFNVAEELGLIKQKDDSFLVSDIQKFLNWASQENTGDQPVRMIGTGEYLDGKFYQ